MYITNKEYVLTSKEGLQPKSATFCQGKKLNFEQKKSFRKTEDKREDNSHHFGKNRPS
jgi:hypothetical protein